MQERGGAGETNTTMPLPVVVDLGVTTNELFTIEVMYTVRYPSGTWARPVAASAARRTDEVSIFSSVHVALDQEY